MKANGNSRLDRMCGTRLAAWNSYTRLARYRPQQSYPRCDRATRNGLGRKGAI